VGAGAPALDARTGHVLNPASTGLRRRDRRQYQDGAAEWSLPRAASGLIGRVPQGHWKTITFVAALSPQWHESAVHC